MSREFKLEKVDIEYIFLIEYDRHNKSILDKLYVNVHIESIRTHIYIHTYIYIYIYIYI